ncbi:hypothetical protein Dfri01_42560 [Dyadobacter frigoris]|nr:hypothetical protein Dfri01_42560 [Dyadobacter frigoris]
MINAQDVGVAKIGKSPYVRLREADIEYRAAVARHADIAEIAELSYILGKRYTGLESNHKAKYWFLKSLTMLEPFGPSEDIGKICIWLCSLEHHINGNTDTTMLYARRALFNFQAVGSASRLIGAYAEIGGIHAVGWTESKKGIKRSFNPSIDSAFFYEEEALKMAVSQNRALDIGLRNCGLANLWSLKNDKRKEISFMRKGLNVFRRGNFFHNEFLTLLDLSKIYLSGNRFDDAKKMLNQARTISDKYLDVRESQMAGLEAAFASYFQKTGNWEKAFEHQRRSVEYRENEFRNYRNGAEEGIISLLENERKEVELKAKNTELALRGENLKMQQRLNLVTGLVLFLTVIAVVFFFKQFKRFKRTSEVNAELVLEQSHRIKNNLQSVSSLLSLQRYRLSDPAAIKAMEESLLRVEAMSLVHKQLYQGNSLVRVELKAYIPDVVESVLRSYDQGAVQVFYDLQDLWLPASKAISLGLIVNELTTNACKYAFFNNLEPSLKVACHELSGHIIFTFSDNGPGFTKNKECNSFGLKLVDLMVTNLSGEELFDTSNGTVFRLSFCDVGKLGSNGEKNHFTKYYV